MTAKKILFLSKGEDSASTRYRAFNYFPALRQAGWEPTHLSLRTGLAGKARILQAAREADVVVILRQGLSFPFLPLLRQYSHKLVFDFDDAIFLNSDGRPSSVRGRRFDNTLSLCDQVWAGNQFLAERAQQINANTFMLPTAIDMARYGTSCAKPSDTIDLVWIGSSSTGKYLAEILPTLEKAAKIEPRLRLKIIADFTLTSDVLQIQALRWQHDSEVRELQSAHIGIAPMPDTPWTRGKCALKVLQYMASRLPVISSNAGANAEVITHERTGLLVSTEQQWIDAIVALAQSPETIKKMGDAGYDVCQQHYSLSACSEKMLAQLQRLVS